MLPAYIIEQLRRREESRRDRETMPRPRLELPIGPPPGLSSEDAESEPRGVAIIELA